MYPCRCKRCRGRKTFKRHPADYKVQKRCSCGGEYSVDSYRLRKEHKLTLCHCEAYWFPHRRGSGTCIQVVSTQGVIDLAELDKEFAEFEPFRRNASE
jgi:hypothetical protein